MVEKKTLGSARFPLVEISGQPYQMGWMYGQKCHQLIREFVKDFDDIILPRQVREKGRKIVQQAIPLVRKYAPELYEEMEGIAAGTGLPLEEIFKLNCSSELYAWLGCEWSRRHTTVQDACTSFALSQKDGSLVAWNMDWWPKWQKYLVLLHGIPDFGQRFLCVAMAGALGRPGLAEKIALAANYLPYRAKPSSIEPETHWSGPGVPYNILSRMILQQRSTEQALKLLRKVPRMACVNYTIGDWQGNIVCVETLPSEMAIITSEEKLLVHANNYHSSQFHGFSEKEQEKHDPRAWFGRQILRKKDTIGKKEIYLAQRAHFPGKPAGICRHVSSKDKSMTLLSFVAEVGKKKMTVAYGPPCQHRFFPYTL
ncbi:MAG: C45 family peptidase [Candidatus Omnitrophica bacterium]|nr:C45 family peptidase [Candidatus Omnitrophota bacterium]